MISSGEPKDGDFVAYLEDLERRQLAHLPAHPLTPVTPARPTVRSGTAAGRTAAAPPPALVGGLVLGLVGLFFLLLGLVGDGGWIATAVGAFLAWRGVSALTREVRDGRSNGLAAAQQQGSVGRPNKA